MEKMCNSCKEIKPFSDFYRDSRTKDKRMGRCKSCDKLKYDNTREQCRIAMRKTRGIPEPKEREKMSAPDRKAHKKEILKKAQTKYRASEKYQLWKEAYLKQYHTTESYRLSKAKRKYRRKSLEANHVLQSYQWNQLLTSFDHSCAYCGNKGILTRDHFIPLKLGGATIIGNIVPACRSCNSSKGAKKPNEWCQPDKFTHIVSILKKLDPEGCALV